MMKPITKLGNEAAVAFRAHVARHFTDHAAVYLSLFRPLWEQYSAVIHEPNDASGWRNFMPNPDNAQMFHGWVHDNHYGAWLCVCSMFPLLSPNCGRGLISPCPVPLKKQAAPKGHK